MLNGIIKAQREQAPKDVWVDWSYAADGHTEAEDIFTVDDAEEMAAMVRKPVRYIRVDDDK